MTIKSSEPQKKVATRRKCLIKISKKLAPKINFELS